MCETGCSCTSSHAPLWSGLYPLVLKPSETSFLTCWLMCSLSVPGVLGRGEVWLGHYTFCGLALGPCTTRRDVKLSCMHRGWYTAWHVEFHALEQKKAGSNQASAFDSLDRCFTLSRSALYPCRFSLASLNSYLLMVLQCINQSSASVVDCLCHRTLMV